MVLDKSDGISRSPRSAESAGLHRGFNSGIYFCYHCCIMRLSFTVNTVLPCFKAHFFLPPQSKTHWCWCITNICETYLLTWLWKEELLGSSIQGWNTLPSFIYKNYLRKKLCKVFHEDYSCQGSTFRAVLIPQIVFLFRQLTFPMQIWEPQYLKKHNQLNKTRNEAGVLILREESPRLWSKASMMKVLDSHRNK